MRFTYVLKSLLLGTVFGLASATARAADLIIYSPEPVAEQATDFTLPAVSGINGKLEAAGGFLSSPASGNFKLGGSLSIPLGHSFGFQGDLAIQASGAGTAYGAAGHLFARDPSSYLLGLTAGVVRGPTGTLKAIGPEGELYLGDLSLEGWAGYAHLDYDNILQPDLSGAFVVADVAYYVADDWRVSIGGSHILGYNALRLGTEYQFRDFGTPFSVTGDFKYGQDGNYTAMLGLKGYLGGESEKSLIDRHRQDDPPNRVLSLFSAAGGLLSATLAAPGATPAPVPSDFDDEASCQAASFEWDGEFCVYPT